MIDIEIIGSCVRPQFIWDIKSHSRWHLRNMDRDEFFCKDMGALVVINIANQFNIEPVKITKYLAIPIEKDKFLTEWLENLLVFHPVTDYDNFLQTSLRVKSQLAKNLVFYRYKLRPGQLY